MSVLVDLHARLVAQGYAGTVQLARLDATPDAVLCLRQYQAEPSRDRDARDLPALERLAVQMLVRGAMNAGLNEPMNRAEQAYRALSGRHLTINARRYDWVYSDSPPVPFGYDENDRPLVLVNWSIQRWGDLTVPEEEGDDD